MLALVLARVLTPSPSGYGTHTQLFLPPCLFHAITHLPCPTCGLTTSFAHLARGEVVAALHSNLLGPLVFILAVLQIPYRLIAIVTRHRPLTWPRLSRRMVWVGLAVLAVVWGLNIWLAVK